MFHLRDAFLHLKGAQIDREIGLRLQEMARREYVPYITRTRNTTNDEDAITVEKAHELAAWYAR